MASKGIKDLTENSKKHFGANTIKMASFQHGFIDLAHNLNSLKLTVKIDVIFFTTLSKYNFTLYLQ